MTITKNKSFEDLSETKLNKQMQPLIDEIYGRVWSPLRAIDRLSHDDIHPLDKEWGIDAILHLYCGLLITTQEKIRQHKFFLKYNQFTVEYMNNPQTHEEGEFFHLAANYYFYGFATPNEDSFISWKIVDLNRFKDAYAKGSIKEVDIGQNVTKSNASFLCFDWFDLERISAIFTRFN